MYYGEKISSDFLDNHFEDIDYLVRKLIRFVGNKLK
jgi:hypothetical protein